MSKLYDNLSRSINESNISEEAKQNLLKEIIKSQNAKPNVLITGATGCGKSSTINALFNTEKARVGTGSDPETMQIAKYELGNLTLWDSPGLGDGVENDKRHSKGIIDLLTKRDENDELLIDVVLVILDGSSRDLGTSYELINKVIAPCLGAGNDKRLLIGINQADLAMKGKHWDSENHKPEPELEVFLKEKEQSVHNRILEGTGISIQPISYSAGYKEDGKPQEPSYNLSKLLFYIIDNIPKEKRLNVIDNINENKEMWQSDDGLEDYREKIQISASASFADHLSEAGKGALAGAAAGAAIGSAIPVIGTAVGSAVGAVVGAIGGFFGSIFG